MHLKHKLQLKAYLKMKICIAIQVAFIVSYGFGICIGILLPCTERMQEVCTNTNNYITTTNPDPFPTKINMTLKFYEVLDVDEDKQTITLSMKAFLEWQDYRLDVNRSKEYIEK